MLLSDFKRRLFFCGTRKVISNEPFQWSAVCGSLLLSQFWWCIAARCSVTATCRLDGYCYTTGGTLYCIICMRSRACVSSKKKKVLREPLRTVGYISPRSLLKKQTLLNTWKLRVLLHCCVRRAGEADCKMFHLDNSVFCFQTASVIYGKRTGKY